MKVSETKARYLVLDLGTYKLREEERGPLEDPEILKNDKCRTTELWFRRVESGTFKMGSPKDEKGRLDDEQQREVTLTKPYYIQVFEVTQKQYELIAGENNAEFKGDTRPADGVTYDMIRGSSLGSNWPADNQVDESSFLGKLRSKTNLCFDLPTEAQWEYACRAGTTTALNSGQNLTNTDHCPNLGEIGRYLRNQEDGRGSYSEYTKVGSYLSNAWGIYDMHGNVEEWCLDWYGQYGKGAESDPKGPESGDYRVLRGGGWYADSYSCRSASRYYQKADTACYCGFRLVLDHLTDPPPISKPEEPEAIVEEVFTAKYLVLNLFTFEIREENKGPMEDPHILNDERSKTNELWLRRIEPGTFMMGSPKNEFRRGHDEIQHKVTITKPYYIGVFEVTQRQYMMVTGEDLAFKKGPTRPVDNIAYDVLRGSTEGRKWPQTDLVDDDSFFGKLRAKTGKTFDLPTEAQWEYACRAGTTTPFNNGQPSEDYIKTMNDLGRYAYNWDDGKGKYDEAYAEVGSYLPNAWGLYDMHGNVFEWCLDRYGSYQGDETDPRGPSSGEHRVLRGGSCISPYHHCRSAYRHRSYPYRNIGRRSGSFGFRVVLIP